MLELMIFNIKSRHRLLSSLDTAVKNDSATTVFHCLTYVLMSNSLGMAINGSSNAEACP